MTEPLIEVKDLVLEAKSELGWRQIVHGVSFHLQPGEVLGLIGESGAGKSSIGIAAMGRTRPGVRIRSGSIKLKGDELVGASDEVLRKISGQRIAYVAQSASASFNPAHRLIDQFAETAIQEGRMTKREAYQRGHDIFRKLNLPNAERIAQSYPHQVSGGQLQRCMVAMAMACNPEAIVFDEPTTALDVTTQIEVLAAIREVISDYGTAAIYITHDLAVVAQIAQRVMVLRNGREVETATTSRLLEAPQDQYTRDLLSVRKTQCASKPAATDAPLISIEGVTAGYGKGLPVLDNVSIQIHRGQTVAVVGESGSGKSTLGRVLAGLLRPAAGKITFQGAELEPDFVRRDKEVLRAIQMVYQSADTALNPRHTVRKTLGRAIQFYYEESGQFLTERVVELLKQVELDETYLDRRPSELSGGEKQRLCLARALAAKPELIICDEITSALDQLIAGDILRLLSSLQRETGVSYFFITHDIDTVRAIADNVVVLQAGKIVEQGRREEIMSSPFAAYTDQLLASVPEMDPSWLDRAIERTSLVRQENNH